MLQLQGDLRVPLKSVIVMDGVDIAIRRIDGIFVLLFYAAHAPAHTATTETLKREAGAGRMAGIQEMAGAAKRAANAAKRATWQANRLNALLWFAEAMASWDEKHLHLRTFKSTAAIQVSKPLRPDGAHLQWSLST